MNDRVTSFYDRNKDIWGEPQNFRGVDFHPIKLMDSESKSIFYTVFQIPKNYIQEQFIKEMSYLRYLVQVIQNGLDSNSISVQLNIIKFLENITKKKVKFETDLPDNLTGLYEAGYIKIIIDNVEFDEKDFDVIREIILLQNGLSTKYVEEFDISLEKTLIEENNRTESLTSEEEVFKFCSLMRCPVESIKDYTLYQFSHHFKELSFLFQNEIYSPLEISGQIKSKDGKEIIKPYFTHQKEQGRYGSILISWDEFLQDHRDPDMRDINGKSVMNIDKDKK
jgi:hypothetical protein